MGFFDTEKIIHGDGARRSGLLRGSNGTCQKKNCKKARRAKLHAYDSGRNWNEKASRSVSQQLGRGRRPVVKYKVPASATAASGTNRLVPKFRWLVRKKFRRAPFFSCMRGQRLYSSKGELASRNWKARVTLGGREKEIEHFIPASPNSFPSTSHLEKESRKIDALPACRRHILHGLRRNIRHRSDYLRRWIRPRDSGSAVPACAVVPADGFHDRRTLKRAATRRRLLCVGAPRFGKFLGLSGSVAFAGRQHL